MNRMEFHRTFPFVCKGTIYFCHHIRNQIGQISKCVYLWIYHDNNSALIQWLLILTLLQLLFLTPTKNSPLVRALPSRHFVILTYEGTLSALCTAYLAYTLLLILCSWRREWSGLVVWRCQCRHLRWQCDQGRQGYCQCVDQRTRMYCLHWLFAPLHVLYLTLFAMQVAGGLKIRFSSTDAHFVPTGQLLIMATGDCDKPAGRFSQVRICIHVGLPV